MSFSKGVSFHRTPEQRREVALYGAASTSMMAAKHFGCSDMSVRKWMKEFGLPRRRVGNLSLKDLDTIADNLKALESPNGKAAA